MIMDFQTKLFLICLVLFAFSAWQVKSCSARTKQAVANFWGIAFIVTLFAVVGTGAAWLFK